MKKENRQKGFGMTKLIGTIAVAAVMVIIGVILLMHLNKDKGVKSIVTVSSLQKILDVSDLSTFETTYNGVAKVYREDEPGRVKYCVAYNAKVKAGIDFEKLTIEIDEEKKEIQIQLPKVEITDLNVDVGSLDYIFYDKKADNQTVLAEAYEKCVEDVEKETKNETAIKELAQQNAKNIVEALTRPFVEEFDDEYTLEIK